MQLFFQKKQKKKKNQRLTIGVETPWIAPLSASVNNKITFHAERSLLLGKKLTQKSAIFCHRNERRDKILLLGSPSIELYAFDRMLYQKGSDTLNRESRLSFFHAQQSTSKKSSVATRRDTPSPLTWAAWLFVFQLVFWGCVLPHLPPQGILCQQDDDCTLGQLCQQGQCVSFSPERSPSDANITEPLPTEPTLQCMEGQTQSCNSTPTRQPTGTCRQGTQRCEQGVWGPCQGEILPKPEDCNNQDDDCDGKIDNHNKSTAPLQKECQGPCGKGVSLCWQGRWEACRSLQPAPELCNGKDDDCDGKIDNNLSPPLCSLQKGVCAGSIQRCGGTKGWIDCGLPEYLDNNKAYQATEESCDGKDNDCDGVIDPAWLCGCKTDEKRPCYSGPQDSKDRGSCQAGYQLCKDNQWGACQGEILPSREICDGKDNNCNGAIDETDPSLEQPCTIPNVEGPCQQGFQNCVNGTLVCQSLYLPKPEACNGKDDDCDGKIDENCR